MSGREVSAVVGVAEAGEIGDVGDRAYCGSPGLNTVGDRSLRRIWSL